MNFTVDQKIKVLEANGYEVKPVTMEFSRNIYHNDVEWYDSEILTVWKDGIEINKGYMYDSKEHYVDVIFNEIYYEKITNLLCSP